MLFSAACAILSFNPFYALESICAFSVAPCSLVPGTVFSSCGPSCPRSCEDLAVSEMPNIKPGSTYYCCFRNKSHCCFLLSPSTASGSVSQAATVQKGRSCPLMGQSVWTGKSVPAWISALVSGWNQAKPLKPRMDVTTGQNNPHTRSLTLFIHIYRK